MIDIGQKINNLTPMNLDHIIETGIEAVHKGAEAIRMLSGKIHIRKKGAIDLVTEADTGSEKAIIQTISECFPDHAILAEESGGKRGNPDCQWIIDPLDGTTNFAHGLPHYAVSIAFALDRSIAAGIVLNPETGDLFAAARGKGATLNGSTISVSSAEAVGDSLLVTGFPYNFKEILPTVSSRFLNCLCAARGIRRLGSAALDLCYVACGRFDGFWEQNLKSWDTAAGYLIASEAGAAVTNFENHPYSPDDTEILATNGRIHHEMISLLRFKG
jgi:myo-inositol-1(or 4)-monophosphatase